MENFKWIIDEINNTLGMKVYYFDSDGNKKYNSYYLKEINKLDNSPLEVNDGNILDMENFITSILRFVNSIDDSLVLDIPLNELFELNSHNKSIDKNTLHYFSPVDIYDIEVFYYNSISEELEEVLTLVKDYYKLNESSKFKCLKRLYEISKHMENKTNNKYQKK